jgi:hypothetical protein
MLQNFETKEVMKDKDVKEDFIKKGSPIPNPSLSISKEKKFESIMIVSKEKSNFT